MSAAAPPLPPEQYARLIERAAPRFLLKIPEATAVPLARYLGLLDRWRRRTNLTGRLTPSELVSHALESVFGEQLVPHGVEVVDIGSGAGFPGIPLAIVRPDIRVTPVEPRRKRADFLRRVAVQVPVSNCFVFEGRASELAPECWPVGTSRAVGRIEEVVGSVPFLKTGGVYLAWTTEPEILARSLAPALRLERTLPIPGSRKKAIAAFRKP